MQASVATDLRGLSFIGSFLFVQGLGSGSEADERWMNELC